MGPLEALRLALTKEIEAQHMYNSMAGQFPAAKETFLFLLGEEQKHQRLIEKRISEIDGLG